MEVATQIEQLEKKELPGTSAGKRTGTPSLYGTPASFNDYENSWQNYKNQDASIPDALVLVRSLPG